VLVQPDDIGGVLRRQPARVREKLGEVGCGGAGEAVGTEEVEERVERATVPGVGDAAAVVELSDEWYLSVVTGVFA
jgi:hypothetical protein